MKKGFTMIELVFVIVILGILASLAVPKLAATRDDAEAAKAAVEIKDAITQLTTYYIVNGSFGIPTSGYIIHPSFTFLPSSSPHFTVP